MPTRIPKLDRWSIEKSRELYGIRNWGAGYFGVSDDGEVVINGKKHGFNADISLREVVDGIRERGFGMPVLLRVTDLLEAQVATLHESFQNAIKELGYQGDYKGVYPIKVNQQHHIVENLTDFGQKFHHGLEAGSKPELLAAISFLKDPEAFLICNGYKDEEFVDLGLHARKMGINCIFVIEMPSELDVILRRAEVLNVPPAIGVRMRLSTQAGGQWAESGGDRSVFGLNMTQVVDLVDTLRKAEKLDALQLLHYHIGSQIPNIRDIRSGVQEACRVYRGLVEEGAPMGVLDLGGGLAVDYDGSHTNYPSSRNYSLDEYSADIVDTILLSLKGTDIPHPTIVTESGRATVAYSSILLFDILDVGHFEPKALPDKLDINAPTVLNDMRSALDNLSPKNVQECFNDAVYYKEELNQLFRHGRISLRDRALGETCFWHIIVRIAELSQTMKFIPDELRNIKNLLSDIYYGNFSLFQSLPDVWAIEQIFPIMPIHRLDEAPTRNAIISDITCDCDGKIDRFVDVRSVRSTLPLHVLKEQEEYYLGVFLVGAYQETLGDLHNLLGDTNVVTIRLTEDGYEIVSELEGDSVADVLSYVEYSPKAIIERIRSNAEAAVQRKHITPKERREIMDAVNAGIRGYTYFER